MLQIVYANVILPTGIFYILSLITVGQSLDVRLDATRKIIRLVVVTGVVSDILRLKKHQKFNLNKDHLAIKKSYSELILKTYIT